MSAPQSNLDAEREIDLARWRTALVARWWLLAITCVIGPLPTVALNGAEYIAQARIVGVQVPFLEGIRVSILATAATHRRGRTW